MNNEIPDIQVGFWKGRGTRDQIVNICRIIKKQESSPQKIYFCFIGYARSFDCVNHNNSCEILKEMEYQTTWPASWEICMQVKKQQLELDMEQQTSSKPGEVRVKAVCCYPAYSTYVPSASWEMMGWMKHTLESRLSGEI